MIVPKKNRVAVYQYLFKAGVLVAEKDFFAPKHFEINVPNLQVIKLMQSFKSKGYVTEQFNWRHFYWYLTNEGITYLREFLNLPEEIVPGTLKKTRTTRPAGMEGERRGPPGAGRGGYGDRPPRRYGDNAGGDAKQGGPGGNFAPRYNQGAAGGAGGFGRGAPREGGYRREGAPAPAQRQ